jgi:hypothetical protein
MKVTLSIDLDLPVVCNGMSRSELEQLLFDEYVNHATCAHLTDALKWLALAKAGTPDEDATKVQIYEHHQLWAAICGKAEWSFTIREISNDSTP